MQWDSTQYICVTQVNGCLVEGILDTGAAATIMDMGMAMDLGLKVVRETQGEFGSFTVPGRSQPEAYPGAVIGPVALQMSEDVVVNVPILRLISHGRPLFLIGADVLAGSPSTDQWEFGGVGPQKVMGAGHS